MMIAAGRVRWLPAILLRQRQAEEIAKTCASPGLSIALLFQAGQPEKAATSRGMPNETAEMVWSVVRATAEDNSSSYR